MWLFTHPANNKVVDGCQRSLDTPGLRTQLCHTNFSLWRDSGGILLASPRRPGLNPRCSSVGFVVDIVELGQDFSPSTSVLPSQCHPNNDKFSLLHHRRSIIVTFDNIVKNTLKIYFTLFTILKRPASWSSGLSLWLLIMRSRVRFPVLPWGFFLEGEYSHGDHGLGSLVELRFKAPLGTSYITIHLIRTT
jgi:hypothetical protein